MREPRRWKYAPHYLAHIAQGAVIGFVLPPVVMGVLLALGYMYYQLVEYQRFQRTQERREAGLPVLDDWPSRDIADWQIGGWIGFLFGMGVWAWLGSHVLNYL